MVAGWAYYSYNKPRSGVTGKATDYDVSAAQLYNDFASNEAAATEKYGGKVIAVHGVVNEVQRNSDGVLVLMQADEAPGGISCSMTTNDAAVLPEAGTSITIKGKCTGFLMDVNLVDAVIIQ